MPASNCDLFSMQDARNNFDAMRPAPVCSDTNQFMGQYQKIHISTNCYYGYHDQKSNPIRESGHTNVTEDCEMLDVPVATANGTALPQANMRKRSADEVDYPKTKRLREEGTVPSTTNYNPCLLRPTHNNPDISRCLMVHMI